MARGKEEKAAVWRQIAWATLDTAKHLRERDDFRSCASRSYYAAYQAATSVCIAHGDEGQFPRDWNNPTHEQLPDLLANNGNFSLNERRRIVRLLRNLRLSREDADYRPGKTVSEHTARNAVQIADTLFGLLEISDD